MKHFATARERLESLGGCADVGGLRAAVSDVCAQFGKVTKIDVLMMTAAQKRRALCFLRLESSAQEQLLIASLGATRLGEDLLVIVDLAN